MCDLRCDWKLDGVKQAQIEADGSVRVQVDFGEHIITAQTEDGHDSTRIQRTFKDSGQSIVPVELKPVREARLQLEQQVRDAPARAEQLRQERAQQAEVARALEAAQTWTDPSTKLTWTMHDSGDDNDLTWQQAVDYCRDLNFAGHSDWRLPTIDELAGIYDASKSQHVDCCSNHGGSHLEVHVKGSLQLSGWWYRSSTPGKYSGEAWGFTFDDGRRKSPRLGFSTSTRALCLRESKE